MIQAQETISSNDWQAVNSPMSSRKKACGELTPVKGGMVQTQKPVPRIYVAPPCVPLNFEGRLLGNSDQGYDGNGARIPTSDAPVIFSVGLPELF